MPLSLETVEYNLATQLLIIRNPTLAVQDESSILQRSGWRELPPEEVNELVPPTPGAKDGSVGSKLKKSHHHHQRSVSKGSVVDEGSSNSGGAGEEEARDGDESEGAGKPAVNGTPKRVYRAVE